MDASTSTTWTALAVVLLGGVAGATPKRPFLPAIEYASRPAAEWRAELARSGGRSREALWSLFHWDDRSAETVEQLRRWQRLARTEETRREIEVVLIHWGLPVDAPVPLPDRAQAPDPAPGNVALPMEPYAPPLPTLDGLDESGLLARLAADDPMERARAAVTLVRRQREVGCVVRTLVSALFDETEGTWRGRPFVRDDQIPEHDVTGLALLWCVDHAGSAADETLLAIALDPDVDEALHVFVLRQVGPSIAAAPEVCIEGLVELAGRPGRTGELACRWALRIAGIDSDGYSILGWPDELRRDPTSGWFRRPIEATDVEPMLAAVFGAYLAGRRARDTGRADDVWTALRPALRSEVVARALVPELIPWLERDDALGEAAFQALCELGGDFPALRRRYVETMRGLDPDDETGWIPALRHHDGATLAALEAAFDAADDPSRFAHPLHAAGLLDVPWSRMGREVIRSAARAEGSLWLRFDGFERGVRGVPAVAATDSPSVRLEKLSIAIRTLRARGLDATEDLDSLQRLVMDAPPERGNNSFIGTIPGRFQALGIATRGFLDWSIDYVCDRDRYHHTEYGRMLREFPLDRRSRRASATSTASGGSGAASSCSRRRGRRRSSGSGRSAAC